MSSTPNTATPKKTSTTARKKPNTTAPKKATTTAAAESPTAVADVAAAQDQFLEGIRQGQDALVEAVRVWAEAAAKTATLAPPLPEPSEDLPRPADLVAGSFDFAERMLAEQRTFAERLVAAAAPATPEA